MHTKTVETQLNDQDVRIVVGEATVLAAMQRQVYRARAKDEVERLQADMGAQSTAVGSALALIAFYQYPDCLAATVTATGLPVATLTLADFIALPEALVDVWLTAVYALCPEWSPTRALSAAQATTEKNA